MKNALKRLTLRCCRWNLELSARLIGPRRFQSLLDDSTLIQAIRTRSGLQTTAFYALKLYHDFANQARRHGANTDRVLEIGPGGSLAGLACFLAAGSDRAVGIDIQPMDPKQDEWYAAVGEYAAVASGLGWWRHEAEEPRKARFHAFDAAEFVEAVRRVEYLTPVSADRMPLPDETVGFVYSNAVMEHVDQPEAAVREIGRVLRPGGITCHEIDLRDHDSDDSLEFLRYSPEEWERVTGKYGEGQGIERVLDGSWGGRVYCNRLTGADWSRLFVENGFEPLQVESLVTIDKETIVPANLAAEYRNRDLDDLATRVVRITARRL